MGMIPGPKPLPYHLLNSQNAPSIPSMLGVHRDLIVRWRRNARWLWKRPSRALGVQLQGNLLWKCASAHCAASCRFRAMRCRLCRHRRAELRVAVHPHVAQDQQRHDDSAANRDQEHQTHNPLEERWEVRAEAVLAPARRGEVNGRVSFRVFFSRCNVFFERLTCFHRRVLVSNEVHYQGKRVFSRP